MRRIYEHKNNLIKGFTEKYAVHHLVYYEETSSVFAALQREKQLKKWNRSWKIRLIEELNPEWRDLTDGWFSSAMSDPHHSVILTLHSVTPTLHSVIPTKVGIHSPLMKEGESGSPPSRG